MSPDELKAIELTANATVWLAMATFVLAILTSAVAWFTYQLAKESKESSYRQIGVQTWLEMQKRFDSNEIVNQRKILVGKMKNYKKSDHHKISETVLNFFEDVGILYKKELIDKDLTDSSFSFHASRWYEICKHYIDAERKRHKEDESLFEHFEYLANEFRKIHPEDIIDESELKIFLEDESRLVTD
jgi:hypothetical protein